VACVLLAALKLKAFKKENLLKKQHVLLCVSFPSLHQIHGDRTLNMGMCLGVEGEYLSAI
jgi:hypothetical protein